MPLAFPSLSHGTVAFGFFNIETDMLLLQDLFFFAEDLCAALVELLQLLHQEQTATTLRGWRIRGRERVGDLHGAIAGQDLSGFIGATYRRWPFPADPAGFKQNPEGFRTRAEVEALIRPLGAERSLALALDHGQARLAEYRFDAAGFAGLLAYVDRGGHPRWRDERRPAYVQRMMAAWTAGTPGL